MPSPPPRRTLPSRTKLARARSRSCTSRGRRSRRSSNSGSRRPRCVCARPSCGVLQDATTYRTGLSYKTPPLPYKTVLSYIRHHAWCLIRRHFVAVDAACLFGSSCRKPPPLSSRCSRNGRFRLGRAWLDGVSSRTPHSALAGPTLEFALMFPPPAPSPARARPRDDGDHTS